MDSTGIYKLGGIIVMGESGGTALGQINISDVWKTISTMQINIGDSWKTVSLIQINIGDSWKNLTS